MSVLTIVADPGHGKGNRRPDVIDPGACATHRNKVYKEADMVMQIVETLNYVVKTEPEFKDKVKIVMTRYGNKGNTSLSKRVRTVQEHNGDLFISFHMNAATPQAHGTETFYYSKDKDMKLAELVQDVALEVWGLRDRGVKHDSKSAHKKLYVLRNNKDVPACLLECGFITNESDVNSVKSREKRIEFSKKLLRELIRVYC